MLLPEPPSKTFLCKNLNKSLSGTKSLGNTYIHKINVIIILTISTNKSLIIFHLRHPFLKRLRIK
jgi:hypothetical protein